MRLKLGKQTRAVRIKRKNALVCANNKNHLCRFGLNPARVADVNLVIAVRELSERLGFQRGFKKFKQLFRLYRPFAEYGGKVIKNAHNDVPHLLLHQRKLNVSALFKLNGVLPQPFANAGINGKIKNGRKRFFGVLVLDRLAQSQYRLNKSVLCFIERGKTLPALFVKLNAEAVRVVLPFAAERGKVKIPHQGIVFNLGKLVPRKRRKGGLGIFQKRFKVHSVCKHFKNRAHENAERFVFHPGASVLKNRHAAFFKTVAYLFLVKLAAAVNHGNVAAAVVSRAQQRMYF